MVKLSRSKIELFLDCPRCFWLDMKKKVKRPPPAPYTINTAVDALLKQEFDACRENDTAHHLIERYKIDAVPYKCDEIQAWRNNFTGIRFHHKQTDFLVFGAVDDVWINSAGELIVVDFKATGAKQHQIYPEYKRQMEVYQWLLMQNAYKVSKTGYFLFARVNKENGFAQGKLSFDLFIEPQEGDSSWIEQTLAAARNTLDGPIPFFETGCVYCQYTKDSTGSDAQRKTV